MREVQKLNISQLPISTFIFIFTHAISSSHWNKNIVLFFCWFIHIYFLNSFLQDTKYIHCTEESILIKQHWINWIYMNMYAMKTNLIWPKWCRFTLAKHRIASHWINWTKKKHIEVIFHFISASFDMVDKLLANNLIHQCLSNIN